VWKFLVEFEIPFCSLYQEGYTHLGNKSNTVKNPFLKRIDDTYMPASEGEGIFENYSRKSYKEALPFLDCSCVIGIYENHLEIEKINKRIKSLLGKTVKSINFFDEKYLSETEEIIKLLISKHQNVLFCFKKSLHKSFAALSIKRSDSIKILELE